MKIAFTSTSNSIGAKLSPVFGRCPFFVIVETQDEEIKDTQTIRNPAENQRGGAGIAAAQTVGDQKVDVLISGNVGPRAFDVLNQLGIQLYKGISDTLEANLEKFFDNELEKIKSPGAMGRGKGGPGRGQGPGRGPGGSGGGSPNRGRGRGPV